MDPKELHVFYKVGMFSGIQSCQVNFVLLCAGGKCLAATLVEEVPKIDWGGRVSLDC